MLVFGKSHNSVDITTFNSYLLRIDCNKVEQGLKVTPNSQCALDALAIDVLEYAKLIWMERCRLGWMWRIV